MLELVIPEAKYFDDVLSKFIVIAPMTLRFEHSLVSLSKWESEFEKPFLGPEERTREETQAYIRAMCLGDFPPGVLSRFTADEYNSVNKYINAKMTATTIIERPENRRPTREIITSELIYYWMVTYNIPFVCETWHLNRLLMLIKVCNHKNRPAKKMNRHELAMQRHQLNAQRRAALGTNG